MGLDANFQYGQTPLDEEEIQGLLLPTIATHGELDEFEQKNIEQAVLWTMGRTFKSQIVFTEDFVRMVHKRMFSHVWAWAGEFRKTNKNIGVDYWQIPVGLRSLLDDAKYWHEHDIFSPDEMALRFKHRMVSIHCFANGNGRHSRLMADIIIEKIYHQPVFTWGIDKGEARSKYLQALKAADEGDFSLLLEFGRS